MGEARKRKIRRQRRVEGVMDDVKKQVGVLLPGTDPRIGEMVLSSFQANPNAHPAEILAALARDAPDIVWATELVAAGIELTACREKGHLAWLADRAGDYLMGIRRFTTKDGYNFGPVSWPMTAIMAGPPQSITIRLPKGFRRVWAACEGLKGVVMRQSEVIGLANALIERFGGRVLEDRLGPETLQQAFIEKAMTDKAKARALALSRVDALTVEATNSKGPRGSHARVALAEAWPGTLQPGDIVHPENQPEQAYEVESRVDDSWVTLVATGEGPGFNVEPAIWVKQGVAVPEGTDPAVGFTDDAATAPVPKRAELALGTELLQWPGREGGDGTA